MVVEPFLLSRFVECTLSVDPDSGAITVGDNDKAKVYILIVIIKNSWKAFIVMLKLSLKTRILELHSNAQRPGSQACGARCGTCHFTCVRLNVARTRHYSIIMCFIAVEPWPFGILHHHKLVSLETDGFIYTVLWGFLYASNTPDEKVN